MIAAASTGINLTVNSYENFKCVSFEQVFALWGICPTRVRSVVGERRVPGCLGQHGWKQGSYSIVVEKKWKQSKDVKELLINTVPEVEANLIFINREELNKFYTSILQNIMKEFKDFFDVDHF